MNAIGAATVNASNAENPVATAYYAPVAMSAQSAENVFAVMKTIARVRFVKIPIVENVQCAVIAVAAMIGMTP